MKADERIVNNLAQMFYESICKKSNQPMVVPDLMINNAKKKNMVYRQDNKVRIAATSNVCEIVIVVASNYANQKIFADKECQMQKKEGKKYSIVSFGKEWSEKDAANKNDADTRTVACDKDTKEQWVNIAVIRATEEIQRGHNVILCLPDMENNKARREVERAIKKRLKGTLYVDTVAVTVQDYSENNNSKIDREFQQKIKEKPIKFNRQTDFIVPVYDDSFFSAATAFYKNTKFKQDMEDIGSMALRSKTREAELPPASIDLTPFLPEIEDNEEDISR